MMRSCRIGETDRDEARALAHVRIAGGTRGLGADRRPGSSRRRGRRHRDPDHARRGRRRALGPGATTEASPAAPAPPAEPVAKVADIGKAVDCATLSQQFGDTLTALTAPTAKTPLDETVKTTSSEQAGAGRKACMAHDYEAGMAGLRQAIGTLGKKPIV